VDENNALKFDGVDDYLNVKHKRILSPKQVTLECWVKPGRINVYAGLVTNEPTNSSNDNGYGFRQRIDNVFWFVVGREGNGIVAASTTIFSADAWYHLAGTFDGSTLILYVNGIPEGSTTTTRTINSTYDLKIGALNSLTERFKGEIDEIRIWKVARTQAEIQSDMNTIGCGDQNGLVAYYPFNQGIVGGNNASVNKADDITSNNNNGRLKNFALSGNKSNWVKGVLGLSDSVTVYLDADNDTYGNSAVSTKHLYAIYPRVTL
jgi:hypothetical protein